MQVELKIDSAYVTPKIVIMTASVTEEINQIVRIGRAAGQPAVCPYLKL